MNKPTEKEKQQSLRDNPGAAIFPGSEPADGARMEREAHRLNNNPRNHEREKP